MKLINIEARDLPDAWFLCLSKILDEGHIYTIDRGSYEGAQRLEFDHITVHIKFPGVRPLIPDIPSHLGIPNPVQEGYIEGYLPYLMTSAQTSNECYCYCDKTEILTNEGWKLFKDLNKKETVATLNPQTQTIEYQKPDEYFEFKTEEDIYCMDSKYSRVSFRVSKGHKLYVGVGNSYYLCQKSEFKLIPVEEASKFKFLKFKKNASWVGEEKQNFILPTCKYRGKERPIDMNNWLRFLGVWLADGSLRGSTGHHTIVITQLKEDHKKTIIDWCKTCGFKPSVYQKDILIGDKQVYYYLKQFGLQKTRFIPQELKDLPKEQLQYLYEGLMLGDGDRKGDRYTTNSKQLADDFSEICLKLGKGTSTFFDTFQSKTGYKHNGGCYRVHIQNKIQEPITENIIHKEKYSGNLFCVHVPNNHIVFVRYNGKAHWSGNTYGTFLEPQILEVISMFKRDGHGTNQAFMTVGNPETISMGDPPCLRSIDCRVKDNKLHFIIYFRSWDLWGGFPANLGAIQLLKEYMAMEIGVEDGEIVASSKGLHLYDYVWDLAKIRVKG